VTARSSRYNERPQFLSAIGPADRPYRRIGGRVERSPIEKKRGGDTVSPRVGSFIRNHPSVKLCPIENRYFIPVELPTRARYAAPRRSGPVDFIYVRCASTDMARFCLAQKSLMRRTALPSAASADQPRSRRVPRRE